MDAVERFKAENVLGLSYQTYRPLGGYSYGDLKSQWKSCSKRFHPDEGGEEESQKAVNGAFDLLKSQFDGPKDSKLIMPVSDEEYVEALQGRHGNDREDDDHLWNPSDEDILAFKRCIRISNHGGRCRIVLLRIDGDDVMNSFRWVSISGYLLPNGWSVADKTYCPQHGREPLPLMRLDPPESLNASEASDIALALYLRGEALALGSWDALGVEERARYREESDARLAAQEEARRKAMQDFLVPPSEPAPHSEPAPVYSEPVKAASWGSRLRRVASGCLWGLLKVVLAFVLLLLLMRVIIACSNSLVPQPKQHVSEGIPVTATQ